MMASAASRPRDVFLILPGAPPTWAAAALSATDGPSVARSAWPCDHGVATPAEPHDPTASSAGCALRSCCRGSPASNSPQLTGATSERVLETDTTTLLTTHKEHRRLAATEHRPRGSEPFPARRQHLAKPEKPLTAGPSWSHRAPPLRVRTTPPATRGWPTALKPWTAEMTWRPVTGADVIVSQFGEGGRHTLGRHLSTPGGRCHSDSQAATISPTCRSPQKGVEGRRR
jgi:hypothetical protein